MRMLTIALTLLVSSACASTSKLEAHMQARVGHNINSLVDEVGPPTRTFKKPNGDTMYTWVEQKDSGGVLVGQTVITKGYSCNQTYTAGEDGVIKAWQHTGNSCKSK